MECAVSVRDLRKSYGDLTAVNGLSFDVPCGAFFAFLGPNGAGKSTTIQILTSLLKKDGGTALIFGKEPSDPESKKNIGVVFQDPKMDGRLTVRENLCIRASLYGMGASEASLAAGRAIETTGCAEFADRRYGQLSGGQRRRADIARALVHSPRLLILDEPTTGLDPKTRRLIWGLISNLNRDSGITVFLTTHYMEEAAGADDILIISRGEQTARGTPEELRDRYCSDRMVFVPADRDAALRVLDDLGLSYTEDCGSIVVLLKRTADSLPAIRALGDNIVSIEVRTGTLDEAFINITGETIA